jgi:hypothetical protein
MIKLVDIGQKELQQAQLGKFQYGTVSFDTRTLPREINNIPVGVKIVKLLLATSIFTCSLLGLNSVSG